MHFSEKFELLMRLFKVSNKRLAGYLNVDPSLVSRWRSGERAVDGNFKIMDGYIRTVLEKEIPTFKITSLTVENGRLHFVGVVPAKMQRVKAAG